MSRLKPKWRKWRARQQAAMIAYGIAPDRARLLSGKEAEGRQRQAQIIGDNAAMGAELTWRDEPDGTTRFYLVVDPAKIPAGRRDAAVEFLGNQIFRTRH